jgi:hypothetical protein
MEHTITKELMRQKEQGYYESKSGIIAPYFSFRIRLQSEDHFIADPIGILSIGKGDDVQGIVYRTKEGNYGPDGKGLLKLDSTFYEPIHKIFRDLSKIIGENGKAFYSIFEDTYGDDGEGWAWNTKAANSLDEALDKYRFANLIYDSPEGAKLEFVSNGPHMNTGRLGIEFPISKLKQNSKMGYFDTRVDEVAKYFDKLEIK